MYIRQARLKDVKCFADVELRFQTAAETGDRQSNWNVILGENGDGKTTLLQGIAACLMDATTADRMLRPAGWVRGAAEIAALEATLVPEDVDWLPRGERMHRPSRELALRYEIVRAGARRPSGGQSDVVDRLVAPEPGDPTFADVEILKDSAFQRGASPRGGWFSAGYGPFRRLPGELDRAPRKDALEARFATLFDESASLTDCEDWLKDLDRKAAKTARGSVSRRVLREVTGLLSKILHGVEIHVEDEIRFVREGVTLGASQLSHGYRSMFAMTVDILRGLWTCRPGLKPPLHRMPGVVLIDEIDAHLHPEWQREAGFTLCNTFENIQFIVTSHSPFVAMAAGKGALTLLERGDGMVRARQDLPYVRGWAVDRVLSQLFGQHSLRDPETERKLEEYEKLRADRRRRALPKEKASRLAELESYLEERLRGDRDSLTNRRIDDSLAYFARALEERGEKPSA